MGAETAQRAALRQRLGPGEPSRELGRPSGQAPLTSTLPGQMIAILAVSMVILNRSCHSERSEESSETFR